MGWTETLKNAETLVKSAMAGNDASHDAAHAFRVRDLAASLANEEGLSSSESLQIPRRPMLRLFAFLVYSSTRLVGGRLKPPTVELAALLHDIGDYKYVRDPSQNKIVEVFLEEEGIELSKRARILQIINRMGFKEELAGVTDDGYCTEFGLVQDADRLDAIGAVGIARCFTFGGSRNRVLHDPAIQPRSDLSKQQYMDKDEQTTLNHFHEKLLKLKDLMKTKAGRRRAERRHRFMEEYLKEFYEEWDGLA